MEEVGEDGEGKKEVGEGREGEEEKWVRVERWVGWRGRGRGG